MKILVTGGAGFIGSNLCQKLLNNGDEVVCLDNLGTGSISNIQYMLDNKNFNFISADINEKFYMDVEQIYNLASYAAPGQYKSNPIQTLKSNIIGVINILDLAEKLHIPILQVSTIKIHETDHLSLDACYTEGKRCAETLCINYQNQKNVSVKIARLGNSYGPKMSINDSRVMPQFIMKAIRGNDLIIFGDGEQIDSFCYIDDIIDALIELMSIDIEHPVRIESPEKISIKNLAYLIVKELDSDSHIIFNDYNIKNKILYMNDENTLKNWEPKVNLSKGIKLISDYYRKN